MDNFHIDITSHGKTHFELAMRLASREGSFPVRYYGLQGKTRLVFFMYEPPPSSGFDIRELPCDMYLEDYTEFAWSWLYSRDCDFGTPPSVHDGETTKGFRVYTDERGFVEGMWQAFVAVEPKWGLQCTPTQTK